MTLDDILVLAAAGESETVEFKETTGRRREVAQTLCAMLNSQGGRVIFRFLPDGKVAGRQVGDETIEVERPHSPTVPGRLPRIIHRLLQFPLSGPTGASLW